MSDKYIYDEVAYPSFTFPQTHPARLAALAKFYGMEAANVEACRVLELGCGDGANLLSLAYSLPNSEFVGIDLSAHHIAAAHETTKRLDLNNIEFHQADVTNVDCRQLGKFDFIIAHGLYSWVPDFVREAILTIYSECLAENGIGYISYNAYPGCHLRQIGFEMLRYTTLGVTDPMEKVESGIENLLEIAEATQDESVVRSILALEYDQLIERVPSNVFHDEFAPINQPLYFHEFAAKIGEYGFQFLSEADPTSNNNGKLNDNARKLLNSVGDDVIRREQYFDFIRLTRFRRTLFCRTNIDLDRDSNPAKLKEFLIASNIEPAPEANFSDDSPVKFSDSKGSSATINHPLTKTALALLRKKWSGSIAFNELLSESISTLGRSTVTDSDIERTSAYILSLFNAGMVKLRTYQPQFASTAREFPLVSAFARWQIENGSQSVATLTGNNLEVKNVMLRAMIVLLEGSRNREMLEVELKNLLEVPNEERLKFESALPQMIESNLEHMAESGLFVA